MLQEMGYMLYRKLIDCHAIIRVFMFIMSIVFVGLGVTGFAFAFLCSTATEVTVITAIAAGFCGLSLILSLISKHASSFPVSLMILFTGMISVYGANINSTLEAKYHFNQDCYIAFASIAITIAFMTVFAFNVIELSLRPLFLGVSEEGSPEVGSLVSSLEDDDLRSETTTYHYWAYHLVAIGAISFLALFTCFPQNGREVTLMHWYTSSLGAMLSTVLVTWTIFWPMVAKDRAF